MDRNHTGNPPTKASFINWCLTVVIIAIPFHTFLSVWVSHNFGHLYLNTGWKELVLVVAFGVAVLLVRQNSKLREYLLGRRILYLIAAYAFLFLVYTLLSHEKSQAVIGSIIDLRFLLVFFLAMIVGWYFPRKPERLKQIIIVLGLTVAVLSCIQIFLLPPNFLEYFGYDAPGRPLSGVPPAIHLAGGPGSMLRAQATLRGPNVLGAYLILPFGLCLLNVFQKPSERKKWLVVLMVIGVAIVLSQSRSAWLGVAIAATLLTLLILKNKIKKLIVPLAAVTVLVIIAFAFLFQKSPAVRTLLLHETPTVTDQTSNEGHIVATKSALKDIASHAFGHGPGNAGPASALGKADEKRIAENYFLQVLQEVGWLGGLLLIGIHYYIVRILWGYKEYPLAIGLFATFWGLLFTNLLLHTWADDAVALTWWTLAGLVYGTSPQAKAVKNQTQKLI